VLNAPVSELEKIDGLSDNTITALKAYSGLGLSHAQTGCDEKKPILNSWARLMDYCAAPPWRMKRKNISACPCS
jgi:hypothetical protein